MLRCPVRLDLHPGIGVYTWHSLCWPMRQPVGYPGRAPRTTGPGFRQDLEVLTAIARAFPEAATATT